MANRYKVTLTRSEREQLTDIEPTTVFGRIMDFKPLGQAPSFGGREGFVKRSRLVDVEVVHYKAHLAGIAIALAEIELSALNSQCLNRRIPNIELMRREVSAWQRHRNQRGAPIHWRFTAEDARIKLLRLYPKL